jgi:trk system potassium uptake protein TrkH
VISVADDRRLRDLRLSPVAAVRAGADDRLGCFATCAGSTGGGIKMIRVMLLLKQSQRELVRIVHPNSRQPGGARRRGGAAAVLQSVLAYMMIYGATIITLTMLLLFSGLDVVTAFTAIIACVNNIGPGLGEVGPAGQLRSLSDFQTWVCTSECCSAASSCCRCWCC